MYIKKDVERGENENEQIDYSRVEENGEQIMKKNCKNYTIKENFGKGIIKIYICWAFYCMNDGEKVEATSHQVMKYMILCYDSVVNIPNARIK
jgi:hypothetical protein